MGLDIRWPIGFMFTLIGVLLLIFGAATNSNADMYKHSLGININFIWGIVLLIFGVLMLFGAMRGKKNPPTK
jgi:cytochrome c biogenesis protein CcdA